jgi:hypothetical protein
LSEARSRAAKSENLRESLVKNEKKIIDNLATNVLCQQLINRFSAHANVINRIGEKSSRNSDTKFRSDFIAKEKKKKTQKKRSEKVLQLTK